MIHQLALGAAARLALSLGWALWLGWGLTSPGTHVHAFISATPSVTPCPTPSPTSFPYWCTPPACATDEVLHCPADCPRGCGYECATTTPTPTGQFCPTQPGPTGTVLVCGTGEVYYCPTPCHCTCATCTPMPGAEGPAAVPESPSLILLGVGLAALALYVGLQLGIRRPGGR
jgi:hypothetical protein